MYSRGRVQIQYIDGDTRHYGVNWRANGKEWTTEKALKTHLLKCIKRGVELSGWEIMEFTQQPSKSLNDWCDSRMTMAILKRKADE